jgi:tetratricopeptide (TPR) repeat protein
LVSRAWSFLPEEATPFMLAALNPPTAQGDTETLGRELLRLVFGPADDGGNLATALTEDQLRHRAFEAFESDPAVAARAAAAIAAFRRRRADAGDVQALVELGNFLYWDDPQGAQAAYQEAIDAGHLPALIDLGMVLGNVLDDEEAARKAYERAAASDDPDVRAHAMYRIACLRTSGREAALQQVIGTRHPEWAAAAMVSLAGPLMRRGDLEGAAALFREAVQTGTPDRSAHASSFLADILEDQGDLAGATAIWQRLIDSRSPDWAAPAFNSLVHALAGQDDADGLRAAYVTGAALANPEAPYALLQLGQLLEARGDLDGAHAAWQQAIDAGCDDPDYWRERMSPAPEPPPEPAPYPPHLPPRFNPRNMVRTGLDVLDHGLLPLPDVLTYDMALPVAYWTAEQCAVVLILRFISHRPGEPTPAALPVTYSRAPDGTWQAPAHTYIVGGSFSHDPIANPGSQRHLGGNAMVYGSTRQATQVTPGQPAFIATGSAAPEVRYLAVVKDGHEDRRRLESHFGAWVVCTEQPGPFDVAGLSESGDVLARLPHHSRRAGPRDTTVR